MIEFFYYTSPNARKVLMMLEETETPYEIHWVDILVGDQHSEEYRAVNPNGKVPAVIDHDAAGGPIRLFESGAILLHLAERSGSLMPTDPARRAEALSWTFWQMAGQGPGLGQAAHFVSHAPNHGTSEEYSIERFTREARRLYQVLDDRLADREWLADEFSIADIACFPWVRVAKGQGIDVSDFPAVGRWSARIAERDSAKVRPEKELGVRVPKSGQYTHEQWKVLFEHGSGDAPPGAAAAVEADASDADEMACPIPAPPIS